MGRSAILARRGIQVQLRHEIATRDKAMSGDLAWVCEPATAASSAAAVNAAIGGAAAKFTRQVSIRLQRANGDRHSWFDGTVAIAAARTGAGTIALAAADASPVTFTNGERVVTLEYTGAWQGGVLQKETATAVGTITKTGNAAVVVTSALFAAETLAVAVLDTETADLWAEKVRTALAANAVVAAHYTVSGATNAIILTAKVKAANDATLNISLDNGTCTGITTAAASANTTAGVAADTTTLTVTGGTLFGYTLANATSVDTLTA
jgi:hypothetical protein